MEFTKEQIDKFAPDDGTLKRAKGLAKKAKWSNFGQSDNLLWGFAKGSGKNDYQVAVDLSGPAFKCNCPARKFPCKHSMALLMLRYENDGDFVTSTPPEYAQTWIDKRKAKVEKVVKRASLSPLEKQAQNQKSWMDRYALMQSGMQDLQNWLEDLLQEGIISLESGGKQTLDTVAVRMVDAKLGNIGRRLREISDYIGIGNEWPELVAEQLSGIYMLTKAFARLEQLPSTLQREILNRCGVNVKKDEIIHQEGVKDMWMVLGQNQTTNVDGGSVRKTWLLGHETNKYALVIEFDYNHFGFEHTFTVGSVFEGTLVYYPSIAPLRALIKVKGKLVGKIGGIKGNASIDVFLKDFAQQVAANPWQDSFPTALHKVVPLYKDGQFFFVDTQNKGIPIKGEELPNWQLLAISGGRAVDVFGAWDGKRFEPISMIANGKFESLLN